jgi:hypothetical protein
MGNERSLSAPRAPQIHTFQSRPGRPVAPTDTVATPAFTPPKKTHPYYQYGPLLSRNAVYNFLAGARGLGKTFGAKNQVITRALKTIGRPDGPDQFIYLRRYEDEMKKSRDTFFDDIAWKFPEWDFRVFGNTFQLAPVSTRGAKKREWTIIGHAAILSKSQQLKSVAYPRVKWIIFDEFIIEKGVVRYLPNEATVFNNFYSTVDRYQDKTRVLFLANAVSIDNPYFLEYDILPTTEDQEFIVLHDGFIVVHFPNAEDFTLSVQQTRFGKFISGTEYAKYAVLNEFGDNNLDLVRPKNPNAKHMFNLETKNGWMSLWEDVAAREFYAYSKLPSGQRSFTLIPEHATDERHLVFRNEPLIERLLAAYRAKRITFDSPHTFNRFVELFKKQTP